MFRRKKKMPLPPVETTPPLKKQASKKTKDAIAFFSDKKSAVDMLEDNKSKKFIHSGYKKTMHDKFFELIEGKDLWQSLALIGLMVFVISVVLWGISQ